MSLNALVAAHFTINLVYLERRQVFLALLIQMCLVLALRLIMLLLHGLSLRGAQLGISQVAQCQ